MLQHALWVSQDFNRKQMEHLYYSNLRRVYLQRGCWRRCGQRLWEPQEIVQVDIVTIPSSERRRKSVVTGTQIERGSCKAGNLRAVTFFSEKQPTRVKPHKKGTREINTSTLLLFPSVILLVNFIGWTLLEARGQVISVMLSNDIAHIKPDREE